MTAVSPTQQPIILQQTIFQISVAGGGSAINDPRPRVAELVRAQGYRVLLGRSGRNHINYMWYTDGERVACIEVRRTVLRAVGVEDKRQRYQVPIRGHDKAHLLLMLAVAPNGQEHPFLIPMSEIAHRRNIAIWSENPANYRGQWMPYLNDWDQLEQVVSAAPTAQGWGLTLFE